MLSQQGHNGLGPGSDATTSEVWQRSKLHSTWVLSTYVLSPAESYAPITRSGFCDLQPVFGTSAKDTFALLEKQLASIACPTPSFADEAKTEAQLQRQLDMANGVVRSYIYCSDGGPDQRRYKKLLASALYHNDLTFLLPVACVLHSNQLVVKDSFMYLDHWSSRHNKVWKYFPSLAKVIYVWRDNASSCLAIWRRLYGDLVAAQFGQKLPAKAIAGRWGSVFACHQDIQATRGCMLPQQFHNPSQQVMLQLGFPGFHVG